MRNKTNVLLCGGLGLVLIGGCTQEPRPEQTVQVSNRAYQLDQLFSDPKGNTVYRFYDQGDWRYYVVGPNGVQMLPSTRTVVQTVPTSTGFLALETRGARER